MAEEIIIKLEADTTDVSKSLADVKGEVNETKEATGQMQASLDKATGGMISGFKAGAEGIKKAVVGMKTLRGAIIATGIGALVLAFSSLTAYFSKTERGAEQLRVIMAVLGAVVDSLMDVVIHLGEALFKAVASPKEALKSLGDSIKYYFQEFIPNAVQKVIDGFGRLGEAISLLFKGEFSAAADAAASGISSVADGFIELNPATALLKQITLGLVDVAGNAIDAAGAANSLERALNGVLRAERQLTVDRAKANRQIAERMLLSRDENLSLEERVNALNEAAAIEKGITDREIATQNERLRIMKAKADLAESDAATLDAIADQEARVEELRTASFMKQRELVEQTKALVNQAEAAKQEAIKKTLELRQAEIDLMNEAAQKQVDEIAKVEQALLSAQDREWQAAYDHYAELITLAEKHGIDATALREQQAEATKEITLKYAKQESDAKRALDKQEFDDKVAMGNQAFEVLGALAGKNAKAAKAVAVANTIWNTATAIMKTLAQGGAFAIPAAVGMGIMGAAQLANILKTSVKGAEGGGGGGSITTPTTSVGASSAASALQGGQRNQVNEIIGGGRSNQPIRAYVVSGDVTTQQGLDRRIKLNAEFGG